MMKLNHLGLIAACSFLTLSCDGDGGGSESPSTGTGASALEKYLGKPAELLTEAQAAELCGSPADAEFELSELPGDLAKYSTVEYKWPSERKQKVKMGNMEMEVNRPFSLSVSLPTEVKVYGENQSVKEAFDQAHKTITAEEAAAAKKAMNEAFNKQTDKKEISESDKDVAEGLGGSIIELAMTSQYEKIDNVGDAAYWEPRERKLDVLSGNLKIGIVADVAENDEECKNAAIKVAKLLMN